MTNFNYYHNNTSHGDLPVIAVNERLNDPSRYLPSQGLMNAVNVALHLQQPLLLTGEPGTGKTQLAHHIADFFNLGDALVFNAQTTSQAKDLFYRYDALTHFQWANTQKDLLSLDEVERRFIRYEGLGAAIRHNKKSVVLLDEIDKAPRDLPNDILAAIEKLQFDVPEIGKTFAATNNNRPIIIMTSNSEKNLPDAFLRRVVYYHIPFPDAATLLRILHSKVGGYVDSDLKLLIQHFEAIRKLKLRKSPATAELINWVALLHKIGFDAKKLNDPDSITKKDKELLELSYTVLAKNRDDLREMMK